jgi:rRNA maturation endonuclease Nob1
MDIICESCEAEFFVDTKEEVKYCVTCGEELSLQTDEEWLDEYEEELGEDD